MTNEKILDKLKKILALGKSSNAAEAEAAIAMAGELMTRHNLTMSQVDQYNNNSVEYIKGGAEGGERLSIESKFIWSLIQDFFFVKIISQEIIGEKGEKRKKLIFVGTKENVEIAEYTYSYLKDAYQKLWVQYRSKTGANTKLKQSFYIGLHRGLKEKLTSERKKVENSMALVVVEDKELERAFNKFFPATKEVKKKIQSRDYTVEAEGYQKGKEIKINKGIENRNNTLVLI